MAREITIGQEGKARSVIYYLIQFDDGRIGRFHHVSVAALGPGTQQIRGERFGACINDGAAGHGSGDHGRHHPHCTILQTARALIVGIHIIVNIGAGTNLRKPGDQVGKLGGRVEPPETISTSMRSVANAARPRATRSATCNASARRSSAVPHTLPKKLISPRTRGRAAFQ